jgi:hypothetical protein
MQRKQFSLSGAQDDFGGGSRLGAMPIRWE